MSYLLKHEESTLFIGFLKIDQYFTFMNFKDGSTNIYKTYDIINLSKKDCNKVYLVVITLNQDNSILLLLPCKTLK